MDKRLKSIVSFVQQGDKVVDIGTDHGLIPLFLHRNRCCNQILATDISKLSLQKLIDRIEEKGYTEIKTLQTDGFKDVEIEKYNTFIISGMGGHLITEIIRPVHKRFTSSSKLILQPNNAVDRVRNFLIHNGFVILEEDIQLENNKYYEILYAKRGRVPNPETFNILYGEKLIEKKSPILACKLYRELRTLYSIRDQIRKKTTSDSSLENILSKIESVEGVLRTL